MVDGFDVPSRPQGHGNVGAWRRPIWARAGAPLAVAVSGALVLAACSGSKASATTPASAAVVSGGSASSGARQGPPGVSGTIAQVAGSTMEVQSTSSQTTVTWTASTRITQTVAVSLASVAVGDCVTASGAPGAGASGSTPSTVAAQQVAITPAPSSGTCTAPARQSNGASAGSGGFRGGFGGAGGFGGGFRRAGAASAPSGKPVTVTTASGTVTAVSGSSITVSGFSRTITFTPGSRPATGSSGSGARPPANRNRGPVSTVTVSTTGSTTFAEDQAAGPSALVVGRCATAFGPQSNNGAVAATTIAVRPAPSGGCSSGFGPGA